MQSTQAWVSLLLVWCPPRRRTTWNIHHCSRKHQLTNRCSVVVQMMPIFMKINWIRWETKSARYRAREINISVRKVVSKENLNKKWTKTKNPCQIKWIKYLLSSIPKWRIVMTSVQIWHLYRCLSTKLLIIALTRWLLDKTNHLCRQVQVVW